jgi:murein L,D-transpeptidase YcbB/YkuD
MDTLMAVKQFQRDRGIDAIGTTGPLTRAALDDLVNDRPSEAASARRLHARPYSQFDLRLVN